MFVDEFELMNINPTRYRDQTDVEKGCDLFNIFLHMQPITRNKAEKGT